MKEFIGKRVEFLIEGLSSPIRAKVLGHTKDMILVKGEKDKFTRRIIKGKVIMFMPLEEVESDQICLMVLFCENPTQGCPGVFYIKEGEGFSQKDLMTFMAPCEARCETCRCGSKGEIKNIENKDLSAFLAGTLYGDYPEGIETNE